jgi:hypothetical protein
LNDEKLRLQVSDTTKLMDNHAYQPQQYEKSLNRGRTRYRKRSVIPAQNPNGNTNLWWQTTGADEMKLRRDQAVELRLNQLAELRKNKDPLAHKKLRRGVVLADEVGIGKTDTCALYRLMVSPTTKVASLDVQRGGICMRATLLSSDYPPSVFYTMSHYYYLRINPTNNIPENERP